ncbi:hypothetical protein [Microvirga massiliensis]|uniref:hypothetical protein n=1 Tax=Microvirga massiliensis TaxID=1033741 RepID=UPI00062B32EC|nr:hypothetical protein [Microvirga massiliensis]
MTDLTNKLLHALKTLVADFQAIGDDETVPDAINVNEHWDSASAVIAEAEGRDHFVNVYGERVPVSQINEQALRVPQNSGRDEDRERIDEDHPVLAAILRVRHRNAATFAPSHSGALGEARDDAVREVYREVKAALESRANQAAPGSAVSLR